jgi:hypothetical protein
MLENEQPGHQPRRQRRLPGSTRHTEPKRPARKSQSISPASRTSRWRRLMISSRGGRNRSSWRSSRGWLIGLPRQRISPSKESRTAQIRNPKSQENRHAHPAFLQNRLLTQVNSSRSINRFLILHGRPFDMEASRSEEGCGLLNIPRGFCAALPWSLGVGSRRRLVAQPSKWLNQLSEDKNLYRTNRSSSSNARSPSCRGGKR